MYTFNYGSLKVSGIKMRISMYLGTETAMTASFNGHVSNIQGTQFQRQTVYNSIGVCNKIDGLKREEQ